MTKPDKNHIHKFKKLRYKSGNETFFCTLPDCNVKLNPALALGKRSLCWRCGEPFILNEYSLRLMKPHCDACHKPKNTKTEEIEIHYKDDISFTAKIPNPPTLTERLQQTIQQSAKLKQQTTEEDEI